jgi:arminomycin 4-O-methyltransferase/SAM-dependent hydroxylase
MSTDEMASTPSVTELPPEFATLMRLADLVTPMALRVAANLRLIDRIQDGAHDLESLAQATDSHRDTLGRLLRHLVAIEVLRESEPDHYEPTALGELLSHRHPVSQVGWLDPTHMIGRADLALIHLFDAVRDGSPIYPRHYGAQFWDDVSGDPVLGATFYDLMAHGQKRIFGEAVRLRDWTGTRRLLDVGGADGDLIATVLAKEPGISATLLELPGPAARARIKFAEAGLDGKVDVVDGSFFNPLPATADVITLSFVLHNWSDEDAVRILRNCAQALEPGGTLLLIECADQSPAKPDPGFTSGDLRMMAYFGGRERTYGQWQQLALAAGLRIDAVSDTLAYGARLLTLAKPSA